MWFLSIIISIIAAPLLPGIINKVKAFFAGRKGPRILQLYYDLFRLFKKSAIYSNSSTYVIRINPIINLSSVLVASLVLPFGLFHSPLGFTGDIVLFFYILGLGRFFTIVGALDTASAFEGMGASREAQFSALVEIVVFAIIAALLIFTKNLTLSGLINDFSFSDFKNVATPMILTALAFLVVLLCENSRVPFDDPETHLELTMVHEAMILDNAGPDLGIILYAASLKLWILSSFFVMLLIPHAPTQFAIVNLLIYLASIFATGVLLGIIESVIARFRFLKLPQIILGAFTIALVATILIVFIFSKISN